MFDKLKQLKVFKDLQEKLSQEKVEIEKQGTRLIINGKLEVEEIILNPALGKKEQEEIIKECFNDGVKKIQMSVAQKMFQM